MNQLVNTNDWQKRMDTMQRSIMDHFLGFDDFFHNNPLETLRSNFPPHNIVNDGDGRYTIELAVAGYTKEDIEVYAEDNSVVVEGKKLNDPKRDYIHKGMSYKAFKRVFPLSKNMTIEDATFENGVLSIHLTKSEELKKLIEIN